jgi:hypothetical protein
MKSISILLFLVVIAFMSGCGNSKQVKLEEVEFRMNTSLLNKQQVSIGKSDFCVATTKLTKSKDVFHILGSFYPIQYDVNEVAMPCLVHFPQWNATGNAQIFMSAPGHFEYYESHD